MAGALGVFAAPAAQPPAFRGQLYNEVASGYLSSGGTLGDTRPVAVQMATWLVDLHDAGNFSGYFWTISSLHDSQREVHREHFNQFETAVYYGYDWRIADRVVLRTKSGPLWNPQIGYKNGHNCDWGWHYVQSFENPVVTPYVNGLWMVAPSPRSRIRFGLQRSFALVENLTLMPFIETVWMDNRRFQSRYGGIPQDRVLGGAFATMTTGFKLTWRVAVNLRVFARFRQYDIINSQSRRAVRRQSAYYAKCDYPIASIGFEFDF